MVLENNKTPLRQHELGKAEKGKQVYNQIPFCLFIAN